MLEGFKKFKKKIMTIAVIKTSIISLSITIITISTPWLYSKIKETDFKVVEFLIIAFALGILSFVLSYLILIPNDKKIAKILDKELGLNEKVQTMIEYQKADGLVINLQREDTESILKNTQTKKLSIKFSVSILILMLVSLSLGTTALAYPKPNEVIIPQNPGFVDGWVSDDWTETALYSLIQTVKNTDFNEGLKNKYVAKLEELLISIKDIKDETTLVATVKEIINYNDLELDKVNTNNEIYTILVEAQNSKIIDIGTQIYLLNPEKIELALENVIIFINNNSSAIDAFDQEFRMLLQNSPLNKNDELYKLLIQLLDDLLICKSETNVNNAVKEVIDKATKPIKYQIELQKANSDITIYIKEELISIFGLESYFKNDIAENEENIGDSSDRPVPLPPSGGNGGYGTGETVVASDDICFDLEKGSIKYGDIIDGYYGAISGEFKDGKIPEEYKELFEKYYSILYGTNEEKNE